MKKIILFGAILVFYIIPTHSQVYQNPEKKSNLFLEQPINNENSLNDDQKLLEHLIKTQLTESGIILTNEYIAPSEIPDDYTFDWSYDVKIASKEGETIKQYHLNTNHSYFGIKIQLPQEIYLIIDPDNLLTVLYNGEGDQKIVTASRISKNSILFKDKVSNSSTPNSLEIRKIGDKPISNINCKGWQTENQHHVLSYYYTQSPLINSYGLYKIELPIAFDNNLLVHEKGLLMQLNLEGIKNAKNNITITCVRLEPNTFELSKREYNRIAGN